MRDDWRTFALGDAATLDLDKVRVEPADEYRIAGVLNEGKGLFTRDVIRGSATGYPMLHRLHTGQLVMRKLTAWEGPITTVSAGYEGFFVSPEFPTFTLDPLVLIPEYMNLLCQHPDFWAAMRDRVTGTVQRRKRLNPSELLGMTIDLPPISDQRRIVDFIGALDKARRGIELATACRSVTAAIIADLEREKPEYVKLADVLVAAKAGATPSRNDPSHFGGSILWLKSGEVDADMIAATGETITEQALERSSTWIMPAGTIVVAMYGATAGAVGFTAVPMACNQAVIGLRVDDRRAEPRFLFHWLRSRRGHMRARRGGSTQPNLNKALVLAEAIPEIPLDRQTRLAALLDTVLQVQATAERVDASTQHVRAVLLADLLSGNHPIPESYNALLERA